MSAKRSNEHAPEVPTKRAKFLAHDQRKKLRLITLGRWLSEGPVPVHEVCDLVKEYANEFDGIKLMTRAGNQRYFVTAVLAVLGDGIIASSLEHKVIVWDLDRHAIKTELLGHTGDVTALVVIPEIASGLASALASAMASGSADHSVKVWNVLTGDCVATLRGHESQVGALAILDDGTLASSSRSWICVWDLTSHTLLKLLHTHTSRLTRAIAGLSQDRLVSACDDGVVMMHAVKSAAVLRYMGGHTNEGVAMCVLPGQLLATAAHDGVVRLWNELPDQGWNELKGHKSPVNVMTMLPDGRLVTGSRDCTIRIWNIHNRTCIRTLAGHIEPILALVFLPDGRLASSAMDSTIMIWDLVTGESVRTVKTGTPVAQLAVLPSCKLVGSGRCNNTVYVWG